MTHERTTSADDVLDGLVARLPRDAAPPPGLWAGIAARLETSSAARSLEQRVRELPTDIAPPADAWPRIAARLRPARARRRKARLAAIASAAAAAAAAVLLGVANRDDPQGSAALGPAVEAPAAATTALGAALMLRSPSIDEDVAETLRRELALVRDERLKIEAEIEREPGDIVLRELWARTYRVELELADTVGRTILAYEEG